MERALAAAAAAAAVVAAVVAAAAVVAVMVVAVVVVVTVVVGAGAGADLLDELLCADEIRAGVGRLISQGTAGKDGDARRLAPAVRQEGHATHSLVCPLRLHVELDDAIHRRLHTRKVQRPDEGQGLADVHPHLWARQAHRHARESSS